MNYTYAHNSDTIFDYSNQLKAYFLRFCMSFFLLMSFTAAIVRPTLNVHKLRIKLGGPEI